MYIIAVVCVCNWMHVHSPHMGSALYMHGSMEITVECLPPQPSRCSGAYAFSIIVIVLEALIAIVEWPSYLTQIGIITITLKSAHNILNIM